MVDRLGVKPSPYRLKGGYAIETLAIHGSPSRIRTCASSVNSRACHRNHLRGTAYEQMAGSEGLEPSLPGSEPGVLAAGRRPKKERLYLHGFQYVPLPLNEMVGGKRFELSLARFRSEVLSLEEPPMVGMEGFEPPLACFQST